VATLPLVATHGALVAIYDLARSPVFTYLFLGLAFASFFWAAKRLERAITATAILVVATLLRLVLLPLPPTLSDDVLRYVWDGRVVTAGFNPYLLPPEAPELTALRDELWQRMPHREVPTVYPPLAQALFSVASWLPHPLISIKILLCFVDLIGCWLLVRLAVRLDLPAGRAVWYAWNPLVTMEVAGMGHVDALGVAATVAAVGFLVASPRRPLAAGAAAAAGALAKLVPLVALPMWTRQSGGRFLAAAAGIVLAATLPVAVAGGGIPPGLVTYGISWEFNGPLYEPLWRLLEVLEVPALLKAQLEVLKGLTGHHELWNRCYPWVYPQLLAKGLLGGLLLGFILASLRRQHPATGSGRLLGGVLLCSATLYPWYSLWVLPWAALCRHRAWLTLSALLPLAYLPQLCGWPLFPWIYLGIWAPFFILLRSSSWSID